MEIGYEEGDVCNRNGCKGIIEEKCLEGCCSCHISPPCGYCITPKQYCPECGWDAEEEQYQQEKEKDKHFRKIDIQQIKSWEQRLEELDSSKISWISKPDSHFTMIKQGVYPEGTTREEVKKKVDGTFGGRFQFFHDGKFKFIAYTD